MVGGSSTRFALIMIFWIFLFASLVAVNTQVRPVDPRAIPEWNMGRPVNSPSTPKSNTVIENRNVNIIVNVDPKDVAKELYKLIQVRLDMRQSRRTDDTKQSINEIEKIIKPMVAPTRRSQSATAFEVAYALDHLTRKALLNDHHSRSTIDDEIVTRDVVARMMIKLKSITETDETQFDKSEHSLPSFRRMQNSDDDKTEENDNRYDDDDQYISVNLKIRKSEILKRSGTTIDIDS